MAHGHKNGSNFLGGGWGGWVCYLEPSDTWRVPDSWFLCLSDTWTQWQLPTIPAPKALEGFCIQKGGDAFSAQLVYAQNALPLETSNMHEKDEKSFQPLPTLIWPGSSCVTRHLSLGGGGGLCPPRARGCRPGRSARTGHVLWRRTGLAVHSCTMQTAVAVCCVHGPCLEGCRHPPLSGHDCEFRPNRFCTPPNRPPTVLQPPARLLNPLSNRQYPLLLPSASLPLKRSSPPPCLFPPKTSVSTRDIGLSMNSPALPCRTPTHKAVTPPPPHRGYDEVPHGHARRR